MIKVDNRSWSRRVGISILLALLAGVGSSMLMAPPAQALEVKHKYYDNWFKSKETCTARGKSLMRSQPDWISFICYRDAGAARWSMDAYVENGFGCRMAAARETEFAAESPGLAARCG